MDALTDAPDGRIQWTHLIDTPNGLAAFEYPHIGLLGHEGSRIFSATANIDLTKRDLVLNLKSNAFYMCKK